MSNNRRMAQLVGHNDCFQLMKLSQICLFRLSKDETLAANIAEIANNGNLQLFVNVYPLALITIYSFNKVCSHTAEYMAKGLTGVLRIADIQLFWVRNCEIQS